MSDRSDARIVGGFSRARVLRGVSAAALLAGGLAVASPAAAQVGPGSPQCPVLADVVTCSGNLPDGILVPSGSYDGLTVENLTADIVTTNRAGIAYTAGRPTTAIRITDPDNVVRLTTTQAGTPTPGLLGALSFTAPSSTNFSLISDIDITTTEVLSADTTDRSAHQPAAILVRGSGGMFALTNRGDVNITASRGETGVANRTTSAGIVADIFSADLVSISNAGTITGQNAQYGIFATLDNRRVDIVNDGDITITSDPGGTGSDRYVGIGLGYFSGNPADFNYTDGYVRPAPTITDGAYRIVNNGTISVTGGGLPIGIEVGRQRDGRPALTGSHEAEITNNGTIRGGRGIDLQHLGRKTITNNGLIESIGNPSGAIFITQGPFQGTSEALELLIVNSATGVIRHTEPGSTGAFGAITADGGTITIRNAGLMSNDTGGSNTIQLTNGGTPMGVVTIENSGSILSSGGTGLVFDGVNTIERGSVAILVSRAFGPTYPDAAAVQNRTVITNSGTIEAPGALGSAIIIESWAEIGADPALLHIGTSEINLSASSIVRGGSGTGAGIVFVGGERHSVVNAGLITATSGNAIVGGAASETIDNSGRIEGSISLAGGDDRIIVRDGGVIAGAIDGGDGEDVLQFDVAGGSALFTDRIAGMVSGFELLEKTGAGLLSLNAAVADRAALLGGTLVTTGNLGAMAVDASAGTVLAASGSLGAVVLTGNASLSPGGANVGALTLASLTMSQDSILRFDLGSPGVVGGPNNDLITVTGNLVLDGVLDINARPGFGDGVYRLINYGGALTDNGLVMGAAPAGDYEIQTSVAGQINLVAGNVNDLSIQFWDGAGAPNDGGVAGGAGTWDAGATNWTNAGGTLNNAWAGNFAVFQSAGGTVTVAGTQSVGGLQFMDNGYRLVAGTDGAIALGAVETIVRVDPGVTAELAVPLTGAGALVKRDTGTLILTGANSYTGGTIIREGVLQISSDGALGAASGGVILDGGMLRLGGAVTSARGFTIGAGGGTLDTGINALTLGGALTGAGALAKTGSGTMTYSGDGAAYAGTFMLVGGSLRLDGTLGGTLQINAGTRLTGAGTLGNLIVAGTLAPGASIGTLNATGNVTFRAGSTYEVEVVANGGTDLLAAAGTATIEGGTVAVTALDPETQYVDGTRYTFLTAAGGVTGTFTGLTENSAFLDFALGYDANSAFLTVSVIASFPDVALTFNQVGASSALAAFGQAAGSDSLAVYNQLLMLDENAARAAFDAASGEIYAVTLAAGLRHGAGRAERLLGRSREPGGEGWGLWGSANGHDGRVDADGNGGRYTHDGLGGELGVDYRGPGNAWAIGVGGGYDERDVSLRDRRSLAETSGWHLGGYARYGTGGAGFSATLSGAYASGETEVARMIAIGTFSRVATARVDIDGWSLGGELRYGLGVGGGWAVGPHVLVTHARADLGRFTETGADSLNLAGGTDNDDSRTRYGGGLFARWDGAGGSIDASAAYVRGGSDPAEIGLAMAGAPSTPYRVRAAQGDGDTLQLNLAGQVDLGGGWRLGANVQGAYGSRERNLQGSATIGLRF